MENPCIKCSLSQSEKAACCGCRERLEWEKKRNSKQLEAFDLLCKEYLSKCRESGCDGCVAEFYCIENHLRKDRYPQNDCLEKLKKYFQSK